MKTVGDWKVNEAWLQQVYKRVCMDKTNLQCLQQFECQHAVANTMYTNSSKTFINQGLRQHNVKNAGSLILFGQWVRQNTVEPS